MAKSPKFMVFHLRELIYTLVFILLGIILIISLVIMFYISKVDILVALVKS